MKPLWLALIPVALATAVAAQTFNGGATRASAPPLCYQTNPPPNVQTRIGRAQIFTSHFTSGNINLLLTRDFVWGYNISLAKPASVYTTQYFTGDRDPVGAAHDLTWYLANQPTWPIYQSNGTTPAYEFGDTNYVPINIENPSVRSYLVTYASTNSVTNSANGWAQDNMFPKNAFGRYGYLSGGLQQLYTGAQVDPAFLQSVADYMAGMRVAAHGAGYCFASNITWNSDYRSGWATLAQNADLVLDEAGWLRSGAWTYSGTNLINKLTDYAGLAKTQGMVTIDQLNTSAPFSASLRSQSLAAFLLTKGAYSYLAWPVYNQYGYYDDYPELYITTGDPLEDMQASGTLRSRKWQHAIGLVNTSASVAANYTLPAGTWYDNSGNTYSGTISIPGGPTGLALLDQPFPS